MKTKNYFEHLSVSSIVEDPKPIIETTSKPVPQKFDDLPDVLNEVFRYPGDNCLEMKKTSFRITTGFDGFNMSGSSVGGTPYIKFHNNDGEIAVPIDKLRVMYHTRREVGEPDRYRIYCDRDFVKANILAFEKVFGEIFGKAGTRSLEPSSGNSKPAYKGKPKHRNYRSNNNASFKPDPLRDPKDHLPHQEKLALIRNGVQYLKGSEMEKYQSIGSIKQNNFDVERETSAAIKINGMWFPKKNIRYDEQGNQNVVHLWIAQWFFDKNKKDYIEQKIIQPNF